ncbi:hypothetical protein CEXT_604731 [Caerostris extrusa]|uniref:Uncharacterized protein n=1 Tax=Caerostris extrusa TaxID=172846 RepID=A0AAV4WBB3_CAEEX|nr:hypothetical protein CEXT_604731 [Caerostris extrusa]
MYYQMPIIVYSRFCLSKNCLTEILWQVFDAINEVSHQTLFSKTVDVQPLASKSYYNISSTSLHDRTNDIYSRVDETITMDCLMWNKQY